MGWPASEEAVPDLAVLAAAGRARAEALVEAADQVERLTAERHRHARPHLPDGCRLRPQQPEPGGVVAARHVALTEPVEGLEVERRLGLQPRRQREAGHREGPVGRCERPRDMGGPRRVRLGVVVGEGHDRPRAAPEPGVAGDAQPRTSFAYVEDLGVAAHEVAGGVARRCVVDDHHLTGGVPLTPKGLERALERFGSVTRADDDRYRRGVDRREVEGVHLVQGGERLRDAHRDPAPRRHRERLDDPAASCRRRRAGAAPAQRAQRLAPPASAASRAAWDRS